MSARVALGDILQHAKNAQAEAQPETAAGEPVAKAVRQKAPARPVAQKTAGKSSQEGYERLTVYVRKKSKDDLARSLIGTGQDMSDVVQQLLDKHLSI